MGSQIPAEIRTLHPAELCLWGHRSLPESGCRVLPSFAHTVTDPCRNQGAVSYRALPTASQIPAGIGVSCPVNLCPRGHRSLLELGCHILLSPAHGVTDPCPATDPCWNRGATSCRVLPMGSQIPAGNRMLHPAELCLWGHRSLPESGCHILPSSARGVTDPCHRSLMESGCHVLLSSAHGVTDP